MNYGYVRVSSPSQNVARQVEEMHHQGIKDENIFIDKQSGKDFNRESYQKLKKILQKGDLLIIKSIDRLGRNYDMIKHEWYQLTKVLYVQIFVIDFPLLDTRLETQNLVGKFLAEIVLEVLSFVAQNERENIKARQAEGIKIAKEKGLHLGRPRYKLSHNFKEIATKFYNKELTASKACLQLKMKKSTFLKYAKLYKDN